MNGRRSLTPRIDYYGKSCHAVISGCVTCKEIRAIKRLVRAAQEQCSYNHMGTVDNLKEALFQLEKLALARLERASGGKR